MFSMTGLSVIGLCLSVGLAYFYSRQLISLLAGGLQEPPSLPVGTPMALRLHIWRGLTFLLQLYLLQLMLWDILFYCYGALKLREISSAGSNLGDSGLLWRSTEPSLLSVLCSGSLSSLV